MKTLSTFLRKHPWRSAGGIIALLAVVSLVISSWPAPPPYIYQGKTVEQWSSLLFSTKPNADEAVVALRAMGPKAVPDLVRLLHASEPLFHQQLQALLRRLPPRSRREVWPRVVPPAAAPKRLAAARALGIIGPPAHAAVPALLKALRHPDSGFALEAAVALTHFGQAPVPGLLKAITAPNANTRQAAAFALGDIQPPNPSAVPPLVKALHDSDAGVRSSAGASLGKMGLPAIPVLVELVMHEPEPVRGQAVTLLLQIYGNQRPITSAADSALDESVAGRQLAIKTLGLDGTADASILAVWGAALRDPASAVRLAALQHWMTRLDNQGNGELAASVSVSNHLANSTALPTSQSFPPLSAEPDTLNRPLLLGFGLCLKDESPQVRELAARCLGLMGTAARPIIPVLKPLSNDNEETVRAAATQALVRIGAEPNLPSTVR